MRPGSQRIDECSADPLHHGVHSSRVHAAETQVARVVEKFERSLSGSNPRRWPMP